MELTGADKLELTSPTCQAEVAKLHIVLQHVKTGVQGISPSGCLNLQSLTKYKNYNFYLHSHNTHYK